MTLLCLKPCLISLSQDMASEIQTNFQSPVAALKISTKRETEGKFFHIYSGLVVKSSKKCWKKQQQTGNFCFGPQTANPQILFQICKISYFPQSQIHTFHPLECHGYSVVTLLTNGTASGPTFPFYSRQMQKNLVASPSLLIIKYLEEPWANPVFNFSTTHHRLLFPTVYINGKPQVLADGKRRFYLKEGIVKAAKDLVTNIQATKSDGGKKVKVL